MAFLPAIVRHRYLGAWFLGVCSILGRWTGAGPLAFRAAAVYGLIFHTTLTIVLYFTLGMAKRLFAGLFGPTQGPPLIEGSVERREPEAMVQTFADLNARLARLEAETLSADAITRARFRNAGL